MTTNNRLGLHFVFTKKSNLPLILLRRDKYGKNVTMLSRSNSFFLVQLFRCDLVCAATIAEDRLIQSGFELIKMSPPLVWNSQSD